MVRGTPRRGEEIVIKEQPYLTHLLQSIATLFFILSEERVLFASAPFVLLSKIPEYPKGWSLYKLLLKVRGGGFTSKASKDGGVCLKTGRCE